MGGDTREEQRETPSPRKGSQWNFCGREQGCCFDVCGGAELPWGQQTLCTENPGRSRSNRKAYWRTAGALWTPRDGEGSRHLPLGRRRKAGEVVLEPGTGAGWWARTLQMRTRSCGPTGFQLASVRSHAEHPSPPDALSLPVWPLTVAATHRAVLTSLSRGPSAPAHHLLFYTTDLPGR